MDNLIDYNLNQDPLISFLDWHKSALELEQNADAMAVSTYDLHKNRPNTRYLLFKGVVDKKIIFYTNYSSPKARELSTTPEVALGFYWHASQKQVRIHGKVSKMSFADSESYFHSRDRESQIASSLSEQSSEIEDKAALLMKYEAARKHFDGKPIPLPDNWGGFLVDPYEYEFFLYGENRLNDRFLFQSINQKWEVCRLQP